MKKLLSLIILIVAITAFSFFVLKRPGESQLGGNKLSIAASFYPMYFFASQIGGDKVRVTNITPAGAEPHDYDLTPDDIIKIQGSKLLILNGNVEPWANKIRENLQGKDVQTIVAGKDLTTEKIKENGVFQTDPHVWLSTALAKIESEKIEEAIAKIDPTNADYYKANLASLESKLDKIDANYKIGLDNCGLRSFITSHAAFGYLSKDYSLTQIAIDGLSPDAEPSLSQLADIADFAKTNNIKVIFFEALVSPKLSETIAKEVHAKSLVLDPIEGISDQDLSKGVNYLTLMADNLQNLRIALQCN